MMITTVAAMGGIKLLEEWEDRKEKFGDRIIVSFGVLGGEIACGLLSYAHNYMSLFKVLCGMIILTSLILSEEIEKYIEARKYVKILKGK